MDLALHKDFLVGNDYQRLTFSKANCSLNGNPSISAKRITSKPCSLATANYLILPIVILAMTAASPSNSTRSNSLSP